MSDARVRAAERTWRATGSVEDETRYLLERVRVGDLPLAHLQGAALLGYPAALEAAKVVAATNPHHADDSDQPLILNNTYPEVRINWPVTFGDRRTPSGAPPDEFDVRAVVVIQRPQTSPARAPIRVRIARARVTDDQRTLLSIEISPARPDHEIIDDGLGDRTHQTHRAALPNCDDVGFPHVWGEPDTIDGNRVCLLCRIGTLGTGGLSSRYDQPGDRPRAERGEDIDDETNARIRANYVTSTTQGRVLWHGDGCGTQLVGGRCPKCGFHPDMQSTYLAPPGTP